MFFLQEVTYTIDQEKRGMPMLDSSINNASDDDIHVLSSERIIIEDSAEDDAARGGKS